MNSYQDDESLTDNMDDNTAKAFLEWLGYVEISKPNYFNNALNLIRTLNRLNKPQLTSAILEKINLNTERL